MTLQREECFIYDHSHLDNNILQRGRAPPCLLSEMMLMTSVKPMKSTFLHPRLSISSFHSKDPQATDIKEGTPQHTEHKWASPQHSQLAKEVSKESIKSMLSFLSSNDSTEKLVLEHGRLQFQFQLCHSMKVHSSEPQVPRPEV